MHPFLQVALAQLGLPAQDTFAGLLPHPMGIARAFFVLVLCFGSILGVMILVGHLRERSRRR